MITLVVAKLNMERGHNMNTKERSQWILAKKPDMTWAKADRINFPLDEYHMNSSAIKKINRELDQVVKKLKAFAKKEKVTLYCDSMDEQGRMVYKIKELPSFVARVHQPILC